MATEAALLLVTSYLLPTGLFLLGWGGVNPERSRQTASQGLLALALATLGYFAVGFAFHLGGAAVVSDQPGLAGLDRLVGYRVDTGLYWGVIGLKGFFLTTEVATSQVLILFATYLPMVMTATLLPMLSLSGRVRGWQTVLVGVGTAAVLFPLAACWAWGGGWLAALGRTVYRGHGLVDWAGSGVVFFLSGTVALGGWAGLGRKPVLGEALSLNRSPLGAVMGALLVLVGWLGWSLSTPFHALGAQVDAGRIVVSGLLALAGGTVTSALYGWLVASRIDPLVIARGAVAGLMAISAGAPFLPPWAGVVVGAIAGLLFPAGAMFINRLLQTADDTAMAAMAALSGLWGLLAVALFADGVWGQGWNGVGVEAYRTVVGQGVTGFLAASGYLGDGPGQAIVQIAGIVAIGLLGFLSGWLVLRLLRILVKPSTR